MKKFILICLIGAFVSDSFAVIPSINQYKIVQRTIAAEPSPTQYSISENDQANIINSSYLFYTQLNPAEPDNLYSIPPYPEAMQLPKIGKWMGALETGQKKIMYVPAHWLDMLSADGRYIIEPINYIFVVYNNNENNAIAMLKNALVNAGFTTQWSGSAYHSDNYHTYIDNKRLGQLKRNDGVFITFSDNSWLHENDHFRVMGPYKTDINHKSAYLFLASVSEETAWDQTVNAGHFYVSFSHARDNLATTLIKNNHPTYYVFLNNILNTNKETTQDHDGKIFVSVFK